MTENRGATLADLLSENTALSYEEEADVLETLRHRTGTPPLSGDEWNALITAASLLRQEARRLRRTITAPATGPRTAEA